MFENRGKIKENIDIILTLLSVTILDAHSTILNKSNPEITELNPILGILNNTFPSLPPTLLLILSPLPVYLIILGLWATPSTKNLGYYTTIAITTTKLLAATNNNILYYHGQIIPGIITLPIIYLPILTLPTHGILKDLQKEKEED